MYNKKAQFYLVTIIIIISIFMGFATTINYGKKVESFNLGDLSQEINIEKRYLLDYISYNQLGDSDTENTFINFSENYIEKIGTDKDIFFIFGKSGSIKIVGNKINETIIRIDDETGYVNFIEEGLFEKNYASIDEFKIEIEGDEYLFKLEEGQNFYYLVNYINNKERYIIYG
jgi:hypothetical protein